MYKKSRGKKLIVLFLVSVFLLMLAGCSNSDDNGDGGEGNDAGESKFTISGVEGGDVEFTVSELEGMTQVTEDVVSVDSEGDEDEYTVTGPLLAEVLEGIGLDQTELAGILVVASDGYSIEVPAEVLAVRDVILAVQVDGEPLDERSQPVRVVIPEERAMFWVKKVTNIELLAQREEASINKIYILETLFAGSPVEEYEYDDNCDEAVKTSELTEGILSEDLDVIYLKAVDGLEKNEQRDVFDTGYIKYTGDGAPMFLGPDIPSGMHTKYILWFAGGSSAFFSTEQGFEAFESAEKGDRQVISLTDIFSEVGIAESSSYTLQAADGYSVDVDAEDIAGGLLYINDDGQVCSYFDGLPKSTEIKGLHSISAAEE